MKIFKFIILIIYFFPLSSFSQDNFLEKSKNLSPEPSTDVSLIQLITNPEKYDGKVIYVVGYLNLEFEGNAIYIHKEDFDQRISKNAIWINLTKEDSRDLAKEVGKKYVTIIGTFKSEPKGHFGMFSGTITEIRRIDINQSER